MSEPPRTPVHRFEGQETLEGAGVKLRRLFGNQHVPLLDPFLLLDNFGSAEPNDYVAGFPWHPHRGIETVTYMLDGRVEHGDSLGNEGAINAGDVQWMSSGSGILHQEMPQRKEGVLAGFQLWVNLPKKEKMSVPAYRGILAKEIPVRRTDDGAIVKVVAGSFEGVEGPVTGIPVDPTYLDVTLPAHGIFRQSTPRGHTVFGHVIEGAAQFDPAGATAAITKDHAALFSDGASVDIRAGPEGARFLFVMGRPLREPVAWYGPIVMNSFDEIAQAQVELRRGDFIRDRKVVLEEPH